MTVGCVCGQVSSIKKISSGRPAGIVDNSPRMVYLKMKDDSQQVRTLTMLLVAVQLGQLIEELRNKAVTALLDYAGGLWLCDCERTRTS
jgi:hypothetical protein